MQIRDTFWSPRLETNRAVTIPHDFRMCEETERIGNFAKAGGLIPGEFQGIHYDDSDVYKVIEGASYSLATHPEPALDKYLDDLIAKAQRPDGYLYTFHTIKDRSKRYSDLKDGHELYCAGHLIEAAVAHDLATGKRSLLDVALKLANHIDSVFGEGKRQGIDGHGEVELALFKLTDLTGMTPAPFRAVPYCAWDHRDPGQMAVWLAEDPAVAAIAPEPTIANTSKATASHTWANDTPDALADGLEPNSSADAIPRLTWWDHRGTTEWVQYDVDAKRKVSAVEVYWFDDEPTGGQCRVPKAWKVLYKEGEHWLPVENPSGYALSKDAFNRATFKPVRTDALRVEVQLQEGVSGGILELNVAE